MIIGVVENANDQGEWRRCGDFLELSDSQPISKEDAVEEVGKG